MKAIVCVVACLAMHIALSHAHSWVACTDYRGDQSTYDESQCKGFPRNWVNMGGGLGFGVDRGYNYQAPQHGNQPCRDPVGSASSNYGYTSRYPMAQYTAGSTVCLAWPSKNHVAATCTNPYIPDTGIALFVSGGPTTSSDPNQSVFNRNLVRNWTEHQNGVIDFKGFQRCPLFCNNMDKSLCSQCFTVPSNLQSGQIYTFQWWWIFNQGTDPYTTCWEAKIVGGSNSGGSTTGRSTTGRSTTGASSGGSTTGAVVNPPVCQQDVGVSGLPTAGDAVATSVAPFLVASSGEFDVVVAYSAGGDRVINVDVLSSQDSSLKYGHGSTTVSAGKGTVTVRVAITEDAVVGTHYVLRTWIVDQEYASGSDAFLYEMSRDQTPLSVASETVYAEDLSECADTQQCADLCGGSDNVSQCNCDQNNKPAVLCAGTTQPVSKNSGSLLAPVAVTLTAAVAALLMW